MSSKAGRSSGTPDGVGSSGTAGLPLMVDSKPALLPFDALPWESFEELVLDLVDAVEDVVEIRPYGLRGEQQHGIDILARTASGEWHAFQTRRVKTFGLSDLRGILGPFLADPAPFNVTRLVIVIASGRVSKRVQDAIHQYEQDAPGVRVEQIWDGSELGRKLRRHPQIVARYFGKEAARRFCDDDASCEIEASPGQPVSEVRDPLAFEVHRAIAPYSTTRPVPELPIYVPRNHDGDLQKVVDRAVQGESDIAILLADSSTGKTRSAWEQLRRLPENWHVWHPASPDELLAGLPKITRPTALWLNELHQYLHTDDVGRDERIAAGLLERLRGVNHAPVLILGTLWHEYRLKLAPAEIKNDLRPQVRALVSGHLIPVRETFTDSELRMLADAAELDPRLEEALAKAEQGHIAQYLAGCPAQIERYETAPPAARAVADAAMDARRLGWGVNLPGHFLAEASLSYLTDLQRDSLPDEWFDKALAYLTPLCRGARGALTRVRPRTVESTGAVYRLADYLELHGKQTRAAVCPPDGFWLAALRDEVNTGDLAALAQASYHRDRKEIADRMARAAAARGDASAVAAFAYMVDHEASRKAALPYYELAAEIGDSRSQVVVGVWHEDRGEWEAAERWYILADDGSNPQALVGRASICSHLGQHERALELYEKALEIGGEREVEYQARHLAHQGKHHDLALLLAAKSFNQGNRGALTGLAWAYLKSDQDRAFSVMIHAMKLGFDDALTELIILSLTIKNQQRALAFCKIAEETGHPNALRVAGTAYEEYGDERRAAALWWRAFNGGLHWALFELATLREKQGRVRRARKIYRRLAAVGQPYALVKLAELYERADRPAAAAQMIEEHDRAIFPRVDGTGWFAIAKIRHERGDTVGAEALLRRQVNAGHRHLLLNIAELRQSTGDLSGAEEILREAIAAGVTSAAGRLAEIESSSS